jgi:hypothetical protein
MPEARRRVPDGGGVPGICTDVADIPANRIVRRDPAGGTDAVLLSTSASQEPKGVSSGPIPVGQVGDVQVAGKAPIEAGTTAIAVGDRIGADSQGRAIPVTLPGLWYIGHAESTSTTAGTLVEVELV